MRYTTLFIFSIFLSCSSNTSTGAFTGGLLGASSGLIATGKGSGALIGTGAGIVAGGLLGAILDQQDRKVMNKNSPRTVHRIDRGDPLTINDVIKLSQNGVSDEAIQSYLENSESSYPLTKTQIRRLQHSGVSQRIINIMIEKPAF